MNTRRSNNANTIELPHVCPCKDFDCNENPVVAYSWQEVEKYFGFRTLPAGIAQAGFTPNSALNIMLISPKLWLNNPLKIKIEMNDGTA